MANPAAQSPKVLLSRLGLVVFALLIVLTHFYRLNDLPAGQYQDESSIAYNAYSIAQTGKDEHGMRMPLFFRAFDNYFDPLIIYNLAPWFLVNDLSLSPLRVLNACIFLLAALAFALLCTALFPQRRWAYFGFFVYSLLPWTFPMSRIALGGNNYMLLGLNLGLFFFIQAYQNHSQKDSCLSALSFSIGLYAYHIARPFYVLLLLALAGSLFFQWRNHKKEIRAFVTTIFVAALPLAFALLQQSHSFTDRFQKISLKYEKHEKTTYFEMC